MSFEEAEDIPYYNGHHRRKEPSGNGNGGDSFAVWMLRIFTPMLITGLGILIERRLEKLEDVIPSLQTEQAVVGEDVKEILRRLK